MRITKHIAFFYLEDRIPYINRILTETEKYKIPADVFIHTNSATLTPDTFISYTNGVVRVIYHDLSNTNPHFLTWNCRDLMLEQKDEYDIFMYLEDDILVPANAIDYWIKYSELLIPQNYNAGFLRIETNACNREFITDLNWVKFDTLSKIGDEIFCINNKGPYCAFWIYDQKEFGRFVESDMYKYHRHGCEIRESAGFGLHGLTMNWYKNTVIPVSLCDGEIASYKLNENCKIYHMSNNYVTNDHSGFANIPFDAPFVDNITWA